MSTPRLKRKRSPAHLAPWIFEKIRASISVKQLLLEDQDYLDTVSKAGRLMAENLVRGGQNFFCGNGVSTADAQHLAAELTRRLLKARRPLAGIGLTTNTSTLNAIVNDYSYDEVFSCQLEGLSRTGDVVVGISTSGNSPNVLRAMESARRIGLGTVAHTGKSGAKLAASSEHCIRIPSSQRPRIREAHISTGLILIEIIDAELFGD